ncbi:glycoside hydrolase family 10 protein [Richelia intracellularis]|uniref:glycoside hydrolase family 10 protein n=1 Tax=Richelia intracellularis TaxID=1164990 RepID=UPI0005C692C7|nr:glycoside hydrolase family 10 protein [Richelia intracellularis]
MNFLLVQYFGFYWFNLLKNRRLLSLGVSAFSVAIIVILCFSVNAQNLSLDFLKVKQTTELRGVWLTNIDSNVLFQPNHLKNALKQLSKLNFNVIYPTVWNWGYTIYPSKIAESVTGISLHPEPGLKNRDVLKELIKEGNKHKLKVIPWFEFGFMAPANSQLAKKRPYWLTSRHDGSKIWKEGTHDRVWLNPFLPDVQDFIQNLIVEIVRKYDIDGIQFDDHFGLPSELGYDPYTVKIYKQEHSGKSPPIDPKDIEWVEWRANKITDFMERIFIAIKAERGDCIVSVAPNPQRFSYKYFLADWQRWERMGFLEDLVIQIYRNDMNVFIKELEQAEVKAAKSHIPVSIGILAGLKNKSVPIEQIQAQIKQVRNHKFSGVSLFFYETLWNLTKETKRKRLSGLQNTFSQPMIYPNLIDGWKPYQYN